MKPVDESLRAAARAPLQIQFIGHMVVAMMAAGYLIVVADLPAQRAANLFALVVVCTLAQSLGAWLMTERWLKPVADLLSGRVDATDENGVAAVRALWWHPGRAVLLSTALWLMGVVGVNLAFGLLGRMEWSRLLTLAPIGLVFAAIAVVGVGLVIVRSCQVAITELCKRLPASRLVHALPQAGLLWGLPVRIITVAAAAVMVALPMMLLVWAAAVLHENLAVQALHKGGVSPAAVLTTVGVMGVLMVGAAAVVAWALGGTLSDPLRVVGEDAARVARGELRSPTVVPGIGETWSVSRIFASLTENLFDVMNQVHKAEGRLGATARTLTDSGHRFQSGAEEQASALNQTSATTEQLAQSARQIAVNAQAVLEIAQKTLDAADSGTSSAGAFQSAVERMRVDNQSIANAVERLRGRVQQIGRIIEFINTVADRSDLLALSAELEGTRAGDVGRGFALVASEMRRLAENVLESTAEVEELITEIREATRNTAQATERGSDLALSSTGMAEQVFRALTDVAELARQTSNAVRTISLATQQQQSGTDQLAEAMSDILAVTQQSLAATRQLGGATQRLEGLSESLRALVDRFRVNE